MRRLKTYSILSLTIAILGLSLTRSGQMQEPRVAPSTEPSPKSVCRGKPVTVTLLERPFGLKLYGRRMPYLMGGISERSRLVIRSREEFEKLWQQITRQVSDKPPLPEVDFALGGRDFRADVGKARLVGDVPFNAFASAISAARINLCITRRSHATVHASSSCRPFELASAGAAIVSNPYDGLERWFEPGSELLIVNDADEAVAAYNDLLGDPAQAEAMGQRARERVLDEHTYRHRARQLLDLVGVGVAA